MNGLRHKMRRGDSAVSPRGLSPVGNFLAPVSAAGRALAWPSRRSSSPASSKRRPLPPPRGHSRDPGLEERGAEKARHRRKRRHSSQAERATHSRTSSRHRHHSDRTKERGRSSRSKQNQRQASPPHSDEHQEEREKMALKKERLRLLQFTDLSDKVWKQDKFYTEVEKKAKPWGDSPVQVLARPVPLALPFFGVTQPDDL
eukprot:GHVT01003196.1.p1 GENE.GHVT01003196.1~~GHVT01003196.1.p1  ORF type:complete len:223 (+),score=58.38 GHVT01003196.1:68-670(+)